MLHLSTHPTQHFSISEHLKQCLKGRFVRRYLNDWCTRNFCLYCLASVPHTNCDCALSAIPNIRLVSNTYADQGSWFNASQCCHHRGHNKVSAQSSASVVEQLRLEHSDSHLDCLLICNAASAFMLDALVPHKPLGDWSRVLMVHDSSQLPSHCVTCVDALMLV